MKFTDALNQLLKTIDATYYIYDEENKKITKNTWLTNSAVEQSQVLRIAELLEQLGIQYEVTLKGEIFLLNV